MKILVLSDSHGTQSHMCHAVNRELPDQILHLGDQMRDGEKLQMTFPRIPFYAVAGNCDYPGPEEKPNAIKEFSGVRVYMTHGHIHGVKNGLLPLELAARQAQAQIVAFGHTHQGICLEKEGLWLLNPGTCMAGSNPSYGVILIESGKIVCYTVPDMYREGGMADATNR